MAVVGDTESLRLLFAAIRTNDPLKRQAQGSLKKLSANLSIPPYLWTEFYAPAFAAAESDDHRRDLLAILDGNSGPDAAAYLEELIAGNHPLRPDALKTLQRWTDISAAPIWQQIATAEEAPGAEITLAQRNIIRLLSSPRITGTEEEKVLLAKWAIEQWPTPDYKQQVMATYDRKLDWLTRRHLLNEFPVFLDDPDIGESVAEVLERARFK
jgi:hypothetical protein